MKSKEKPIVIKGTLMCLTGTKIGGRKDAVGIGETDNPIIRHPISGLPYIPGSSLKGKIRSLLEMKYSKDTQDDGKPSRELPSKSSITAMFGNGNPSGETQPTRLIFRDAEISKDSEKELREALPGAFAEVKAEIAMNRLEGKTSRGSLREQERIPAGINFNFELSIRLFDEDDSRRADYFSKLAEGIDMLEADYLGGNGTRGYGKVKFMTEDGKQPLSNYIKTLK
jgi:CRISPR-associated protein Csm3